MFRIALRTGLLLGREWIGVNPGAPSTRSRYEGFSPVVKRDSWISSVWKGLKRGGRLGTDIRDEVVTRPIAGQPSDGGGVPDDVRKHVVIQPMPELSQVRSFFTVFID